MSREREGVGENMHGRKESVGLDLELIGMPLVGRKFTWFRPNGMARSRIDKVLVSMDCLNVWNGCSQYILDRNIFDHYPMLIKKIIY